MELSQLHHQKQIQTAKARCRLLQAERDALTMALSAVAFELVSPECTESGFAVCLAALSGCAGSNLVHKADSVQYLL